MSACSPSQYKLSGQCFDCSPACSECTGSTNQECLQCNDGYLLTGTTCNPGCAPGKFLSGGHCYACATGCLSCDNSTFCLVPYSPNLITPNGTVVANCPPTYYGDQGHCQPCNSACTSCTGPLVSQCSSCIAGYHLKGALCTNVCDPGTYKDANANCQPCLANC